MALSSERKVFIGVLTLALGSLVVDRGILSGPSEAGAALMNQVSGMVDPASAVTLLDTKGIEEPEFAGISSLVQDRLKNAQGGGDVALGSLFFPVSETPVADQPRVSTATRTAAPMPGLSAIMPDGRGGGTAVIGGRAYKVGDEVPGGFVLVRLVDRSAVLERGGTEHVLTLPVFGRRGGS